MIAKDLLDYLGSNLSVPVYMEVPEELTDYVLLDYVGSSNENHIFTTEIAVQSCGKSLYDAMVLNEQIKEVIQGFTDEPQVTKVKLDTDYNFTNTATKQYRWQAVYLITHYE